jgi:hypothetical protein
VGRGQAHMLFIFFNYYKITLPYNIGNPRQARQEKQSKKQKQKRKEKKQPGK